MASLGESEVVLVDPDGDLILEVGKEHDLTENNVKVSQNNKGDSDTAQQQTAKSKVLRLRVCSKLMIMCSPVFKAMLNGPFCEGRLPLNAAEPPILKLPDDEPVAMGELCKILHHKCDIDVDVFPACAVSTSIAADKYGCATVTRSWFHHQLLRKMAIGGAYSRLALARLIVISYILDDVEAFYFFSIQAYKRWRTKKDENDAFIFEISSNHLPHKVSELLEQAAETYLGELITRNRGVIGDILGDRSEDDRAINFTIYTLNREVEFLKVGREGVGMVAQYIQGLIEFGLWPPQRGGGQPASLEEAICVVRQLATHMRGEQPQCNDKDCWSCRLHWGVVIQAMIDCFEQGLHGLCLVCLKRGDLSASNILINCKEHNNRLATGAFVDWRRDTREYATLGDYEE
ncbi:hypothetical protein FOPE_02318 [Fonsecaea pedrosoi]|nr:hypothetical protein FOPE_02318 [Fonsecaea pedrosoi]